MLRNYIDSNVHDDTTQGNDELLAAKVQLNHARDANERLLQVIRNSIGVDVAERIHSYKETIANLQKENVSLQKEKLALEERLQLLEKEESAPSQTPSATCNERLQSSAEDTSQIRFPPKNKAPRKPSRVTPSIQRVDPNNLSVCLEVYDCPKAVRRQNPTMSETNLTLAIKNDTVYFDHRWKYVEPNQTDMYEVINIRPTRHTKPSTGSQFIAKLNGEQTMILEVYPSQKEAATSLKLLRSSVSGLVNSEPPKLHNGFYLVLWDKVVETLKTDYISKFGRPSVDEKAKEVRKHHEHTGEIVGRYSTRSEAVNCNEIGQSKLGKIINKDKNEAVHNGYYWTEVEVTRRRYA